MTTHPYTRLFNVRTSDPTSGDDIADGYEVGDVWIGVSDIYQCQDNAAGAAVWLNMSSGGGMTFDDSEGDPEQIIDEDAAADGTSSHPARRDHKHHFSLKNAINGATVSGIVDTDEVPFMRPGGALALGSDLFGAIKSTLKTYFDGFYAPTSKGVTNGDSHDHNGGDGAQINHTTLSNIGTNTHAQIDTHIASTSNPHSTTAAQVSAIPSDGWIATSATWTRTGDHTFTVSGDVTATYRKGTRIRYKDGGSYEYGVVGSSLYSSPNTTVNLIPNSDHAMAATTITDTYFSFIESPEGFPDEFNYSPTISASGSMTIVSSTLQMAVIKTCGNKAHVEVRYTTITLGGTPSTDIRVTYPVAPLHGNLFACQVADNGGTQEIGNGLMTSGYFRCRRDKSVNYTAAAGAQALIVADYLF